MFNRLNFGTAGIPISTPKRDTLNGIEYVKKIGLSCMEMEFVHSVNIKKENAPQVKEKALNNNVALTCHGQYYINLNAQEKPNYHASIYRIINAATIANLCGASSLTFHAAYYMKDSRDIVYERVKTALKEIVKKLKSDNNPIFIRPELTGKATQFGDLKELIRLSNEIDQVLPCIDFAHAHARTQKNNSYEEFKLILTELEKGLGKTILNNMHIHLSGIAYTEKGERNHLNLQDSDLRYKELLKAFKEFNIKGNLICESPNIEKDALLLQKTYDKI